VSSMARAAFLTGCCGGLAALLFSRVHISDRDPWQWPSAFMCMGTWLVTLPLAAWYFAVRRNHRVDKAASDSGPPTTPHRLPRSRMTVGGMMGVVLASTLILAVNAPLVKDGIHKSNHWEIGRFFKKMSRAELHAKISNGDSGEAEFAINELLRRGCEAADRAVLASAFSDARLTGEARHVAGVALTIIPPPHPEEIIAAVARELESRNPDMQLSAAWILGEIAPDAPARFEINWGHRGRELFWEKYRANVPRFQHWWKARQERKSSTKPGQSASGEV
jgi:hypothetical protein